MATFLSCRVSSYHHFADGAYAHLQSIGVRHVEIEVPQAFEVTKTLDALAEYGLSVASLQGAFDVADPSAVAAVRSQLETAQKMGCRYLFLCVAAGDTDRKVAYERLRELGKVAADHDVLAVLETHPDLLTNGDVAVETMEAVSHPNVRVNFDTANVYYYNRGLDGVKELKKVIDYLGAVHLKDTNGGYESWHFPTFGEGIVDFAKTYDVLSACGYDGPCTMEIEGIKGESLTREKVEQRVADSVQYLRDLGVVD